MPALRDREICISVRLAYLVNSWPGKDPASYNQNEEHPRNKSRRSTPIYMYAQIPVNPHTQEHMHAYTRK